MDSTTATSVHQLPTSPIITDTNTTTIVSNEAIQHDISADPISDIICGSLAGATGKLIEYPFDTVKVRLQSQPVKIEQAQFKGPLDCFKKSLQSEGIYGLYRGISSPIIGAAAENASLFFAYNLLQDLIKNNGIELGKAQTSLICGAGSGVFASFILTPIELVKCRIQIQMMMQQQASINGAVRRDGAFKTILSIYRTNGIVGFWKGQTGTLIRESGGSASWFGAYEYVSNLLRKLRGGNSTTTSNIDSMVAGAAAGIAYNISLFPADTIKSRMQTQEVLLSSATTTSSFSNGFWSTGLSIYRLGGIRALYRGCGITLCRAAPSSAIIFLVYENLKSIRNEYL